MIITFIRQWIALYTNPPPNRQFPAICPARKWSSSLTKHIGRDTKSSNLSSMIRFTSISIIKFSIVNSITSDRGYRWIAEVANVQGNVEYRLKRLPICPKFIKKGRMQSCLTLKCQQRIFLSSQKILVFQISDERDPIGPVLCKN